MTKRSATTMTNAMVRRTLESTLPKVNFRYVSVGKVSHSVFACNRALLRARNHNALSYRSTSLSSYER